MSSDPVDIQKKEIEGKQDNSQQNIEEQPIQEKQIEVKVHLGDQGNQKDTVVDNEQSMLIPKQISPSPKKDLAASKSQFQRSMTSRASVAISQRKNDKKEWFEDLKKEKRERDCLDICCLDIGAHKFCCSSSATKKDYLEFGIGINLYYRFLKQIGWFFFIFTILSLPQIFFSVIGYVGSDYRDSSNPFEFLMATTIGATSLSTRDCQIQLFQTVIATNSFTLQCPSGDIAGSSFYFGIINSNEQDCLYMSLSELNLNTTNENSQTSLQSNMNSKTSYTFTLSQTDFTESIAGKRVYTGVKCKDATLTVGIVSIKQKIVPIIFASCDALIILLFIYFLINLTVCESNYQSTVAKEQPMIQNYSLQISNLPKAELLKQKMTEKQGTVQFLTLKIKEFIDKQLSKIMKNKDLTIYDLQVSEQEKNLYLQQQLKEKKKNVEMLLMDLKKINEDQYNQSIVQVNGNMLKDSYQQFYDQFSSQCNPQHKKTLDEKNKQITKLWSDIEEIDQKLEQQVTNGAVKYIWVTFDNMQQKLEVQQEMQSLPIEWCQYQCCFCCLNQDDKDKLLFEQHKLQVKEAPNPENINWLNLNYSLKQRIFRQFLSFILTIIILIASFVFISWVNQQKADFQQQYPAINCSNPIYSSVTITQVQAEIDGASLIKGYVECYCKPKLNEVLAGSIPICSDWAKSYAFQQSLPWIMVAGLIIVNVIIQYTFICNKHIIVVLSSFEKHLMISEELAARIFKIFLAQFLNTGLILLISNADFGNSTKEDIPQAIKFLFGGKYGDIDAKWCQNIGIVLLLTLLVNVATQPVMLLVEILVRYMRRAWDQCSCCLDETNTKKNDYQEFRDLYLGEQFRVELRYAQILNAIYVCFMYSPALPFLYFTTLMTIIFLYLVDKISLFKTYRKPVMLDETLSLTVRKYLWIVIIVHLGFATYIYGSSNLFFESLDTIQALSQLSNFYDQKNVFVQWWERSVSQLVTLILLALLALVVLGLFLRNFFYKPMKALFSKCFSCCNNKIKDFKQIQKFLSAISSQGQDEQQTLLSLFRKEDLEEDLKFTIYQSEDYPTLYDNKYHKICSQLKIPIINQSDIKADVKVNDLPIAQSYVNQTDKNQVAQQQPEKSPTKQQSILYKKNLIGLRSFHISYNPNYRKYYDWDKINQIQIVKEQPIVPFLEEEKK